MSPLTLKLAETYKPKPLVILTMPEPLNVTELVNVAVVPDTQHDEVIAPLEIVPMLVRFLLASITTVALLPIIKLPA